jgi:hypothetical protein
MPNDRMMSKLEMMAMDWFINRFIRKETGRNYIRKFNRLPDGAREMYDPHGVRAHLQIMFIEPARDYESDPYVVICAMHNDAKWLEGRIEMGDNDPEFIFISTPSA